VTPTKNRPDMRNPARWIGRRGALPESKSRSEVPASAAESSGVGLGCCGGRGGGTRSKWQFKRVL
jgi:hypothetical protein